MNEKFQGKNETKKLSSDSVFELQKKAIDGLQDVSKQIDSVLERILSAESNDTREELEKLLKSLEGIKNQIEVVIVVNEELMKMMGDGSSLR